ncbi:Hypothetical predicted protein, partial [Paramuricea clavata]
MAKQNQFLLIFVYVIIVTCLGSPRNTKKSNIIGEAANFITSATSKISGSSVSSLGKTMASAAVGYYMSQVESGLSIVILNSMSTRYLVNQKLFLLNGKTVGPPVLIIPPGAKDQSEAKLLFLERCPQGTLCYELLSSTTQAKLKLVCLYFYASAGEKNKFSVTTSDDLNILKETSVKTVLETLTSDRTIGENMVLSPSGLQFIAIAQMTTGENARFFFEIRDNFNLIQSTALKRELVSALAVGLAVGAASALVSAAKKYMATKYGTILTLDNVSNNNDPFILYDPI